MSTMDEGLDPGGFDEQRDPTKVLGRRYLAYLVDFLVITLVAVLALSLTAESNTLDELSDQLELQGDQRLTPDDVKRYQDLDGTWVFYFRDVPVLEDQIGVLTIEDTDLEKVVFAVVLAWLLLYVGLQGFTGATIGKGAAGIRAVRKTGEPPGVLRALVRSIFLPIDSLPSAPFLPLVGTLSAVASSKNRRLGDLVGGTYVIDKDARGMPVDGGTPVEPPLFADTATPTGPESVVATPVPAADPWAQPAPGAPGAAGATPPWAAQPSDPGADQVDWTSEQPVPTAAADPWAPAAGAGTAASDWERVIAEEQAQAASPVEPEPSGAEAGVASASGATIDDYEPQWDEQRRSYIQWDPRRDEWLQYSDELQQWHPIDRPPTS